MASLINNNKGFFVIETSQVEIVSTHPLNKGIFDRCNESSSKGYYVAAMNYWMCPSCYESWNAESIRYSSDIPYEIDRYNSMCRALNLPKWQQDSRDDKHRYKGRKIVFMNELTRFCKVNNKFLDNKIKDDIWIQIQYHPNPFYFDIQIAYENATNPNRV